MRSIANVVLSLAILVLVGAMLGSTVPGMRIAGIPVAAAAGAWFAWRAARAASTLVEIARDDRAS